MRQTKTRKTPVYNSISFDGYLVSKTGKVFNAKTGRELKQNPRSLHVRPDRCVTLRHNGTQKTIKVSRLVLETFVPKPFPTATVNHKNFNIFWDNLKNLEWCSLSDNVKHYWAAVKNGTYKKVY